MGFINDQFSGSGSGERGPRGVAGRGIDNITSVDNSDGTINLTFQYDDGSDPQTFINSLVSDTLIQLDKLTLEGTNNATKFLIKQEDETVVYKCDTVDGINIMKSLLIGNSVKKLRLRDDEIRFIDNSGEHFQLYSENSGSITFKSLNGAFSKMIMRDLNDNEIYNISDTSFNYFGGTLNIGKNSDVGGVKMSVKDTGITLQRDIGILNSDLFVNNGIDIFKVRSDTNETEIYKLLTRDIVSDGVLNFLDGNELLVMKLDTDNRNLELNNTQFTMISGENGITLINEPLTGITSILKTKTDKIIIPDTVLNIVDTNENLIMQVKTDNNVDVISQLNIKSGLGVYTDFPFTTLSNPEGIVYAFQCSTNFLISNTPLVCTGVLDFINQYTTQVNNTCITTGDMTAFSLTIEPNGRFKFSFTAGMSGPFAFGFSPEMAVQIGMSLDPPDPLKIINGGTGVGDIYFLFQIPAVAGTTYNFQSDGLFGNSGTGDILEITSTNINSVSDINIEGDNLNLTSTTATNINAPDVNITSTNNLTLDTTNTLDINSNILDISSTSTTNILSNGGIYLSGGGCFIENSFLSVDNTGIFKKNITIGSTQDPLFAGSMITTYNIVDGQEIFNVNPSYTYIKALNDTTSASNKGCLYYSNETTGELNFLPRPSYDCSFLAWKTNKPVWRIPYSAELVNNPYINDITGSGFNQPTSISGWTELSINDNNIYFNSAPNSSFFTRNIGGNTTIRYVGFPFATNDYKFRISYTVSLSGFNNQTVEIALFVNGLMVETTVNKMVFSSNSEYEVMTRTVVIPLLKNNLISVRINSDQAQITVSNYNMLIETAC